MDIQTKVYGLVYIEFWEVEVEQLRCIYGGGTEIEQGPARLIG